jgi:hypothetical protein
MKAKIVNFLITCLFAINSSAQEWKADFSYKYMYSNQLDKIIQTYNFSRPLLAEKQPLLMHGLNTSVSRIFSNEKKLKHGINLSYSFIRSAAENQNFNNTLQLHFVNLGYILHYENAEKSKGLYTEFIFSATACGLYRNVNDQAFEYDDAKSKSFGIGGDIQVKMGYQMKLKNKYFLSPFISIACTPYLYAPNNEAVVNQTKGLTSANWTSILGAQAGLTIHRR